MKNGILIVKISALSLTLIGCAILAVVFGMYGVHQSRTDSVIQDFKQTVEQIQTEGSDEPTPTDSSKATNTEDTNSIGDTESVDENKAKMPLLHTKVDVEALRRDSLQYNESLKQNQNLLLTGKNYAYAALDLTRYGIDNNLYGYVSAPSIGLELPIYLGANDETMSLGAGHLCYTSLPTGGESTNAVLAGHTGYIGRWLFDSVTNLNVGDSVDVNTYFGKLHYTVTKIFDKAPNDRGMIFIEKGKDKLTLITCIHGGTARRVVVCER